MESNELRIGNYVFYEAPINDWCVEVYSIKILTHRIDINGRPQSYYKPIPITEEILFKCGFEKSKSGVYLFDKFSFDLSDFEFGVESDYYYLTISENIKYLHQLQNLYFALTGEELEINL